MSIASQNLTHRVNLFAKDIVRFCRTIQIDFVVRPLVVQLVKSGTSIGANYAESQNGISRNDFRAKIYICKKEAQEMLYWLEVLETTLADQTIELQTLRTEARELLKIFQAITNKLS